MIKPFLSAILTILVAVPTTAAAVSISPIQVTTSSPTRAGTAAASSVPARAVASSSAQTQEAQADVFIKIPDIEGESDAPGIEPDEIDVQADPQEASGDFYMKIDTIKGESEEKSSKATAAPGVEPDEIDVNADPQEASVDAFIKIPDIEGESEERKGNVEYEWKVEEGESAAVPGVEPDEIDVAADPQPLTPDFGILLGGGESEDDDEETLTPTEELILTGLQGEGAPAETLSLNYEEIKTTVKQEVKLFGFIPVETTATVDVGADGNVEVSFPWWAFLASGKDSDALGQKMVTALSSVLKSKHDALMSTIQNTR